MHPDNLAKLSQKSVHKLLPFRAFCVGDLSQIDDVRPLSVCPMSRSSSSAIIIADYDHHTKISGKSVHFHSFMCAVGTVVLSKQLSCTLLVKDIKDDVSIDHQNRKSSAMMHQSPIIIVDYDHHTKIILSEKKSVFS